MYNVKITCALISATDPVLELSDIAFLYLSIVPLTLQHFYNKITNLIRSITNTIYTYGSISK